MITIQEFADIIQCNLTATRYNNQEGRCVCHFEKAEIKEGECFLKGEYGTGKSFDLAQKDYAKKISGKLLVIDALGTNRREFKVPQLNTN